MAMYHKLSSAYLFIILGDYKQLPPTVLSLHVKLMADDETSPPFTIVVRDILAGEMTSMSITYGTADLKFKSVPHN